MGFEALVARFENKAVVPKIRVGNTDNKGKNRGKNHLDSICRGGNTYFPEKRNPTAKIRKGKKHIEAKHINSVGNKGVTNAHDTEFDKLHKCRKLWII